MYSLHLWTTICGFYKCTNYTPLRIYHRHYEAKGSLSETCELLELSNDLEQERHGRRLMGGPGSGTWARTDVKRGSDSLPRLSISDVEKAVGISHPGNVGRLCWTFRGDAVAAYRVTYDGVNVHLRSESGTRRQSVELTSTPCHFGGERQWFLCPDCGRRAAVFYLVSNRWSCRLCGRVRYSCHQEGPAARLARRMQKVRHRLGVSANLMETPRRKPKGMHWTTFIRLAINERRLRAAWFQCVAAQLPDYLEEFRHDQQ